jgi:hypothetical protein
MHCKERFCGDFFVSDIKTDRALPDPDLFKLSSGNCSVVLAPFAFPDMVDHIRSEFLQKINGSGRKQCGGNKIGNDAEEG